MNPTNCSLLNEKIAESGLKKYYIADKLNISRYGLMLKLNGTNEFKTSEVQTLCDILGITSLGEKERIFFGNVVDK